MTHGSSRPLMEKYEKMDSIILINEVEIEVKISKLTEKE